MLTRGDFHIHSTASDGKLSPREIVMYARKQGIDTIAITDHNSTSGIYEAATAGMQYGVSIIPAVELSTRYNGESIHLLGYFRDNSFYYSSLQYILKLLRAHKFLEARSILSNFMYTNDSRDFLSVTEGITLLRAFGAAVVLAHPVRINKINLLEILNLPFDGIEAKYCGDTYFERCFFVNTALSRFSFYTGGSDFHTDKSGHQTHCYIGEPYLNEMEIQMFISNSGVIVY